MLSYIKRLVPQATKEWLRPLKIKWIDNPRKKKLFLNMQKRHKALLQQIKGKEKIKVVFLVIHKSIWKAGPLFQKMLNDPLFDPVILVCPYTAYGEKRMWSDMEVCLEYFQEKKYPLISSYNTKDKRWLTLQEINTDIVFFTNPHQLTLKQYYEDAYLNYLSCYVPYYSDIASAYDFQSTYNQKFHNAVWLILYGDKHSVENAQKYCMSRGVNCKYFGSLFLEDFFSDSISYKGWKHADKKRIVYAPHQSIIKENNLHLSTFLHVADFMVDLAKKYEDIIEWSFKPHPILKSKLYKHPEWGKERTDNYYSFWGLSSNSHINEGEYIGLFKSADAIIHDCGSFILEALLSEKPCAYLHFNGEDQLSAINQYGLDLIRCHYIVSELYMLERFVVDVVSGDLAIKSDHKYFLENQIYPFYKENKPSDIILAELKRFN